MQYCYFTSRIRHLFFFYNEKVDVYLELGVNLRSFMFLITFVLFCFVCLLVWPFVRLLSGFCFVLGEKTICITGGITADHNKQKWRQITQKTLKWYVMRGGNQIPGGKKNGPQENCSRSMKKKDIYLKTAVCIVE